MTRKNPEKLAAGKDLVLPHFIAIVKELESILGQDNAEETTLYDLKRDSLHLSLLDIFKVSFR